MTFEELFEIEKKYLGGGYYHPRMYGTIIKDARYATSGETMLDIDRKNGGTINTSPAGIKFWSLIDNAVPSKSTWKWNYMGGPLQSELSKLAAQMLYPSYVSYSYKWLSKKSQEIVHSDSALTFNFLYAVFNGPGWFKYFANAMNIYVDKQGITDPKILMEKMIYERIATKNSLIIQGANTIKKILPLIQGPLK